MKPEKKFGHLIKPEVKLSSSHVFIFIYVFHILMFLYALSEEDADDKTCTSSTNLKDFEESSTPKCEKPKTG